MLTKHQFSVLTWLFWLVLFSPVHASTGLDCSSITSTESSHQKSGFYLITKDSENNTAGFILDKTKIASVSDIEDYALTIKSHSYHLNIELSAVAAKKMEYHTKHSIGRKMAFMLNDEIVVAATIQAPLSKYFQVTFTSIADAESAKNRIYCMSGKKPKSNIERFFDFFKTD